MGLRPDRVAKGSGRSPNLRVNKIMPQRREMTPAQYAALEPDKVLRVMQIIAGALIAGVVMFGGVACILVFGRWLAVPGPALNLGNAIQLDLGAVGAALLVVMSFVVPKLISAAGVKSIARLAQDGTATGPKELFGRLLAVAQAKMIIAMALVEAAAFFNLFVFINTKLLIPLAVVGALLLVMAIHFPTKLKLARWLEDQQRLLS